MISVDGISSPLERFIFDTISINSGIPIRFGETQEKQNTLSILYFHDNYDFCGNSIYIHKSKETLNDTGKPVFFPANGGNTKNIPVFYPVMKNKQSNVIKAFTNNSPAIWQGYDDKYQPYIVVNFDLIKNIAYHLTRLEEQTFFKSNVNGRFPTQNHTLIKYELEDFPVVDFLTRLLTDLINILDGKINRRKQVWPQGNKYAVCLTHDVDHVKVRTLFRVLYRSYSNIVSKNTLKNRIENLQRLYQAITLKKDIFNNFDEWMEIEDNYGFRSSFYFLSRKYLESIFSRDRRYSIKKKSLKKKIQEIRQKGWEVGLHGYQNSPVKLKNEKRLIDSIVGSEVIGVRQHYVDIRIPETWHYYQNIGLKYDASFGFHDVFGFRAGTSFPFFPYDLENDRKIPLLVIPALLMDTLFIGEGEINRFNKILDTFLKFKQIVSSYGGVMTLVWHQEYLNDFEYSYIKNSYHEILKLLSEDATAFVGSAEDIYFAWLKNVETIEKS